MMKDLIIPVPSENQVDVSQINPDFKGIIIAYKGDKAVGYIQYCNGSWYIMTDIDMDGNMDYDDTPLGLITSLVASKKCTHFKVIEFAQ